MVELIPLTVYNKRVPRTCMYSQRESGVDGAFQSLTFDYQFADNRKAMILQGKASPGSVTPIENALRNGAKYDLMYAVCQVWY